MVILRPRPSKYLQLVTRTASDIVVKHIFSSYSESSLFLLFTKYIYKLTTIKTKKNNTQYLRTENNRSSTRRYYYYICQIVSESTSRRLDLLLPLCLTPFRHLPSFLNTSTFNCHMARRHVPFFFVLNFQLSHGTPPCSFLFRSYLSTVTWHSAIFLYSSFSTFNCHMARRHVPFFFVLNFQLSHGTPPCSFLLRSHRGSNHPEYKTSLHPSLFHLFSSESRDSLITQ